MPSGPKRRRAKKKKEAATSASAAAAEREKYENEASLTANDASLTASSKENGPVMKSESIDDVTAVFEEPTAVLLKKTVLVDNILALEVLHLKRKDTNESIKENALPTEIQSSVQSLNVAEPLETSPAGKIDVVVGETSVVDAPRVIELDSQEKDGGSMMSPDCDLKEKVTEGTTGNSVPTEIYSIDFVTEPQVTSPANETDDIATELLQDEGSSIKVSDYAAFSVMMDNAVISVNEPCDPDDIECLNAENAVLSNVDTAEDQKTLEHKEIEKNQNLGAPKNGVAVENHETAASKEIDAPEKTGEALQLDEAEAAAENVPNEADALEKIEETEQPEVGEAAAKNKEAAILGYVNDIEKNTLEAVAENQETAAPSEVNPLEKTEAVQSDEVEAAVKETVMLEGGIDAKPAVDLIYQTHEAVPPELVTPGVRKQIKEVKEMAEDILNRLNALDALLHRN